MCAGAAYWTGIGRIVYGLSEHRSSNSPAIIRRTRPLRYLVATSLRTASVRLRSSAHCLKMKQHKFMRIIGTRTPGRQRRTGHLRWRLAVLTASTPFDGSAGRFASVRVVSDMGSLIFMQLKGYFDVLDRGFESP